MWFHKKRRWGVGVLAAGAGAAVLLACGPNFPVTLLFSGDGAVLGSQTADFWHEIKRLAPPEPVKPGMKALPAPDRWDGGVQKQSAEVDASDLRAAMGAAATPELLERYARARGTVAVGAVPANVPPEFALHLRGLASFKAGNKAVARAAWEALLAMPAEQRRWRTTWASFMLGRSYLGEDPARAVQWLRRTRELAAAGFSDSLGLASSSLGWEAKAELERGNVARAIELYLEQLATGDPTAAPSLRLVAERLAQKDAMALATAAGHAPTRRVVTAYLLARGGPVSASPKPLTQQFAAAWLKALEITGAADVAGADRAAWAAYQHGDMGAAERWLAIAPGDSGIANWIRAKLLLRAGKLDAGAAMLAKASAAFPPDERWNAWHGDEDAWECRVQPAARTLAEAGVVMLARGQYAEALDCLLRGGFWNDAAYVAERVLTVDELRAYLDRAWPACTPADRGEWWDRSRATPEESAGQMKYLLARRLARLGRFADAAPYMPEARRGMLVSLGELIRTGREQGRGPDVRARSLFAAAQLLRAQGMELVGTELGPDGAVYGGDHPMRAPGRQTGSLLGATAEENARAVSSGPAPDTRYHYRYLAANLAWDAAALMPDQSEQTATVLCTAGIWLKGPDPKEADRFYKALVRRCGKTALGAEAARIRWFPKLPDVNK